MKSRFYVFERPARVLYGPGKLSYGKGTKLFLECIQFLPRDIEIVICGSGEMGWEVKEYIASERVHRICFYEKLPHDKFLALMKTVDVAVSCIISADALPRAAIEPLTYGIPVVGLNQCAYPEVVDDGKNGFLVNQDPKELASAVCRILGKQPVRADFTPVKLSMETKRKIHWMKKMTEAHRREDVPKRE